MIALKNVTKTFGDKKVLSNVSLRIEPGHSICVTGKSGSGKTTLLHLLIRAIDPTSGTIEVDGVDISMLPKSVLQLYRQRIGIIYQPPIILDSATVRENIALPLHLLGAPLALIRRNTDDLMKRLHLDAKANEQAGSLSMSERAVVGIARALILSPMIIFADEPFRDLDDMQKEIVSDMLCNMQRKGASVVSFSRDSATASALNAVTVQLVDGTINKEASQVKTSIPVPSAHRILEKQKEREIQLVLDETHDAQIIARKEIEKMLPVKQKAENNGKRIRITSIGSSLQ